MLKSEMDSYVRIEGRGLKILTYPYIRMGGGVKNCQNHSYIINEWLLTIPHHALRVRSIVIKSHGHGVETIIDNILSIKKLL